MISQKTIDAVKARVSLLDIVGETVQIKRQGSSYVGLCPFHSERSPSFHIRDNEQFFHCFGCGKSGNAFTFLMESKGLSFPEAVEELAQRYGIDIERTGLRTAKDPAENTKEFFAVNQAALSFFRDELSKRDKHVVAYAKERRLTKEAFNAFGIGFAPHGNAFTRFAQHQKLPMDIVVRSGLVRRNPRGELYDALRGRLVFPIFIDTRKIAGFGGRVIPSMQDKDSTAPKYLNSPETPVYHKSKVLFGLPQAMAAIKEQSLVYVVEGYLDVIGLWQSGVKNVVATCGTALTEDHVKKLSRITKRIVLLFDADGAGRAAAAKSFVTFLNAPVDVWAVYLEDGEDPDSVAAQYGPKTRDYLEGRPKRALIDCYFDAVLKEYGVSSVDDLGASTMGSIASGLAGLLGAVKDPIAKLELGRRAAHRLKVPFERFESLSAFSAERKESGDRTPADDPSVEETVGFYDLPKLDQSVLTLVMGKKEEFSDLVLKQGALTEALSPPARGFIEQLSTIFGTLGDEGARKEGVKVLLKAYDSSWTKQWKIAHDIFSDPASNPRRQLEDCVLLAEKSLLSRLLERIQREVSQATSESEKESLFQQVVEIKKQHQALASRTDRGL